MSNTLFTFIKGSASNADDTDPETSSVFYNPPMTSVQNVVQYRRETIPLNTGDTHTISLPDSGVDIWSSVMARVIGHAKVTTTGYNWDGVASITGVTAGYGTDRHPGYISMSTANVNTFTLTGLADNTTVEYLAMILTTDESI